MARWSEGDPRWIVDHREDGKNVNGWHWCASGFSPVFGSLQMHMVLLGGGACWTRSRTIRCMHACALPQSMYASFIGTHARNASSTHSLACMLLGTCQAHATCQAPDSGHDLCRTFACVSVYLCVLHHREEKSILGQVKARMADVFSSMSIDVEGKQDEITITSCSGLTGEVSCFLPVQLTHASPVPDLLGPC